MRGDAEVSAKTEKEHRRLIDAEKAKLAAESANTETAVVDPVPADQKSKSKQPQDGRAQPGAKKPSASARVKVEKPEAAKPAAEPKPILTPEERKAKLVAQLAAARAKNA